MANESWSAPTGPKIPGEEAGQSSLAGGGNVIEKLGLLDLTGMKSPDDLAGIARIENVGLILVPESLLGKLSSIPMKNVGSTVPIPEGENVRLMTGAIKLSGEALADPAVAEDTLVVAGVLHVTTPIERVAYRRVVVVGVVLAPKGSEAAIGAAISRLQGVAVYYSGSHRVLIGQERLSSAFLDLLEDQTLLVLVGGFRVEPDVTPDLLRRKVREIALIGSLNAPRAVVPLLQLLAVERQGVIAALEDEQQTSPER